jgi:hypothetical protein
MVGKVIDKKTPYAFGNVTSLFACAKNFPSPVTSPFAMCKKYTE